MIGEHFGQHASDGPQVDLFGVVNCSQQQLGCPIVPRTNVSYVFLSYRQHFGRPEVAQFGHALLD